MKHYHTGAEYKCILQLFRFYMIYINMNPTHGLHDSLERVLSINSKLSGVTLGNLSYVIICMLS